MGSNNFDGWSPQYELDGVPVDPDRLYEVRGGCAAPSPVACPRGHRLGPWRVLVGWQSCRTVGGHGTHTCVECGYTIFTPPMRPDCRHHAFDERLIHEPEIDGTAPQAGPSNAI